jgi:hypothetical protein
LTRFRAPAPENWGSCAFEAYVRWKGCLHDSRRAGRTALVWRKVGFSLFAFYLLLSASITHARVRIRACQLCLPYFRFARGAELGSASRVCGFGNTLHSCTCNLQPAARPGLLAFPNPLPSISLSIYCYSRLACGLNVTGRISLAPATD